MHMRNRHRVIVSIAVLFSALGLSACDSKPAAEPIAELAPVPQAPIPAPVPATPEPAAPVAPAPAPAAVVLASAELGAPAPAFTLSGADGKSYSLSDFKGKTVVLEWFNPDCPFSKHAHTEGELKSMAKRVMGKDLVWLSINSGGPGKQGHGLERNAAATTEYAMSNPILLDETGAVGHSYGAIKTPHMFIVDAKGVLIYRGGIDNAPIGKVDTARPRLPDSKEAQLINYVDTALEDLKRKRALRLSDTPPYGCTIKYSS